MRYSIFSDNSPSPLEIYTMGFGADAEITRFGPGKRDFYIIHYVTKGKGYYNGNVVTEGQGFLIFPGQLEEYFCDKSNPWEFFWVISSDDNMKEIFERYNANVDTLIFDYDSVPIVKKIAGEIILQNNEIVDSLKMLEMFLRILNSHVYTKKTSQYKLNSEIYLDFCLSYIEANIYKKIMVSELTGLLGVSQPYLYKIFSRHFNMSAKKYITWHKINRAKKLLIETEMSVTQIANSVGYNDILAFSKAFSQKEKMSPQKYRLVIRNKA